MHLYCTSCFARYRIGVLKDEQWQRCAQCKSQSTLVVPNAENLLNWAENAPWDRLLRLQRNIGTRGHDCSIRDKFVRIFNERRDDEIGRIRFEDVLAVNRPIRTRKEQKWDAIDKRIKRRRSLDELRKLNPKEFEKLVADLFIAQGYRAKVIGGPGDCGLDVVIHAQDGSRWGVAQCKRYKADNPVSTEVILNFGGAYMISDATFGFLFTTGELTRNAKETAKHYEWLTIYSGEGLMEYIEEINKEIDESLSAFTNSRHSSSQYQVKHEVS